MFCWIATLWGGRLSLKTPLLWVIGFIVTFVIGGLSGVMVASAPLDLQLTQTYFVVAHLHYVLVGGAMFPLFGAFCYWYPKATGRLMSERCGRIAFALILGGFNLGFFPMHILGLMGMPRRIYTYGPETGWGPLNMVATAGTVIAAIGAMLFVANAVLSLYLGRRSGPDPWGGPSLEWACPSPPPSYNFELTPVVDSITPLWPADRTLSAMHGLSVTEREVLVTSTVDAVPDYRQKSPKPSLWPLACALATWILFVGSIFTPWALVWGSVPLAVAATGWFWPHRPLAKRLRGRAAS